MPDNSGIFSCAETPLNVSPSLLYNQSEPYYSYYGKFNSPTTGPMIYKNLTGSGSGVTIEENTLTTFTKNGIQYSLSDVRLFAPGLHNVTGTNGVAELCMFFQNINASTRYICICVPIYIDEIKGALYFSQLDFAYNPSLQNRQTLGSIFTFNTCDAIEYVGVDIRSRSINNPNPESVCKNLTNTITYTILNKPVYMKQADLTKIRSAINFYKLLETPKATIEFHDNLIFTKKYVRLCKDIQFTYKGGGSKKSPALKCYNLDPTKDIGPDGTLNLNKDTNIPTSFEEEMNVIKNQLNIDTNIQKNMTMYTIETIIAIVISAIVALIVLWIIGYTIFTYFSTPKIDVFPKKGITIAVRKTV